MPAETENDRPAALARAAVSLSKGTAVLWIRAISSAEERRADFVRCYKGRRGRVDLNLEGYIAWLQAQYTTSVSLKRLLISQVAVQLVVSDPRTPVRKHRNARRALQLLHVTAPRPHVHLLDALRKATEQEL